MSSGDIFNLPRNLKHNVSKTEEHESECDKLNIEFTNHPKYYDSIKECVYNNMREILFRNNVKLIDADWSKKSEFYGIFEIDIDVMTEK